MGGTIEHRRFYKLIKVTFSDTTPKVQYVLFTSILLEGVFPLDPIKFAQLVYWKPINQTVSIPVSFHV